MAPDSSCTLTTSHPDAHTRPELPRHRNLEPAGERDPDRPVDWLEGRPLPIRQDASSIVGELSVAFAKPPEVRAVRDEAGKTVDLDTVQIEWHGESHRLAYLVTAEVYVSELLDREQFRRHCDRCGSFADI